MLLSGNLFAKERKGADLIIQKQDGTQVRGELIAVKENSLLLMERESGADVTVDIENVNVITVVKRSKALLGAGLGSLFGAAWGALVNETLSKENIEAKGFIGLGIFCGILAGAAWGVLKGKDRIIQIKGCLSSGGFGLMC